MKFRRSAIILLVTFLLSSCSTVTHDLSGSKQVGGAQGQATIDMGDQFGNIPLQVKIENLPPADRAAANATTYVVWVRPTESLPNEAPTEGLPIRNIGALREGELKTKIEPFNNNFELFVTAEPQGNVDSPTSNPVFWTHFKLSG
jgi:hypothetical protein